VLNGEGVGWLRVGRLKKLFEDEGYRAMAVSKLNKTLDRKIGPDDHIDDVVRKYLMLGILIKPKIDSFQIFFLVYTKTRLERNVEIASAPCCWLGI
jgi:hypothetical protein